MHVLIVEDEVALAESLADGLRVEGFAATTVYDGDAGFEAASTGTFDVIVLDIMLPKRNGFRVCSDLRSAGVNTPILMLTAKQGELDEAEALDTGADDYLSKPFSLVVLLARLRAIGRRATSLAGTSTRVQRGDLTVDIRQRRCWRNDREISLTARELDLLATIVKHSPDPIGKNDLLAEVWGDEFAGDPNVVEVYVGYLRRKVDVPFGRNSIVTVRGLGYRFDAER